MTALLVTLVAVALILLRVPVAFALLAPSLAYIFFASPFELTAAAERAIASLNTFPLLAIPLFIFAGNLANVTGMGEQLFDFAQRLVGRVRGGLAYVHVLSSLGFSWMSGNAVSDVAVIGSVQVPQMQKRGYSNSYVGGITAASSLVTPLMPPSVPAIIFGVASGVSIGALFLASVVPALVVVVLLLISVWIYARKRDDLRMLTKPEGSFGKAFLRILPLLFAPVIVLGGILGGIFTPTEAAGVLVAYTVIVSLVFTRSLSWANFVSAVRTSFDTTASVLLVVASASVFGWVLTVERVPQHLGAWVVGATDSPQLFLILAIVFLLIVGMLMDPVSAILVTTPVLFPIALSLGVDPVHFGVLLVFCLMIGLFTPPVGIVLFVLESVSTLKMPEILKGVTPYVVLYIGVALLIAFVPQLTTALGYLVAQ